MRIHWTRCKTYEAAKDFHGVVYVHEWDGKAFYWGICDVSVFGGNPRKLDGIHRNPRYGASYRHWIEGCLRHGGALYVGVPSEMGNHTLEDLELTLIGRYPSQMNDEQSPRVVVQNIQHEGDIPRCIQPTAS